jgi:hypothetical protein
LRQSFARAPIATSDRSGVDADRLFWPLTLTILACLFAIQVRSASQESVTADEPLELSAGYTYLKTGDFRMEPIHPPLSKVFAAVPLLRFALASPPNPAAWQTNNESLFAAQWLAANAGKEDTMILAGRLTASF